MAKFFFFPLSPHTPFALDHTPLNGKEPEYSDGNLKKKPKKKPKNTPKPQNPTTKKPSQNKPLGSGEYPELLNLKR